jgi:hypothetical protein
MGSPWGGLSRKTAVATALVAAAGVSSSCLLATEEANAATIEGPLCIPGSVSVPVTADAKVSQRHPNRHYGASSRWKINFGPATLRSFVNFNLPTIPFGCSVTEAMLEVTGHESGHPHPATGWPGAMARVYVASGRWSERGITWNNRPRGYGCWGPTQDYAKSGSLRITATIQDAYGCLDTGRLKKWNGLKFQGWSPQGWGAHWRFVVDSRESAHPPVVHISWG